MFFIAKSRLLSFVSGVRSLHISASRLSERLVAVDAQKSGVWHLVLSNPKKRNVLSLRCIEELLDALRSAEQRGARVAVLRAQGSVFSAGHDLSEIAPGRPHEQQAHVFDRCTELMLQLQSARFPVLASVAGLAAAAGCQLVASCDLVIAAESASFSVPGVRAGLFCSTPGVALTRALSNQKLALQMLMTGETLSARDAHLHGLVGRVVPDAQLEHETQQLCERLLDKSAAVLALGKRAYYTQRRARDLSDAYRYAARQMLDNLRDVHDAAEGIRAFQEKRAPRWTHT